MWFTASNDLEEFVTILAAGLVTEEQDIVLFACYMYFLTYASSVIWSTIFKCVFFWLNLSILNNTS